MTQTTSEAYCLTTNDCYRNAILTLCGACYKKAKSKHEFAAIMADIQELVNHTSDYPTIDKIFVSGAALALANLRRDKA